MKHKFYSLLVIVLLLCMANSFVVSANETKNNSTNISATVKVNRKYRIKKQLNIKKAKDFTFTSSNDAVATVSSKGVVTVLKAGKATITVTSNSDNSVFATINITGKNRYTKKQLRLMSAIIYSEAGGQSYAGKKAVGIVVMNRVRSSWYPNTLKGVIYQPYQFSPARNGSLDRALSLYDEGGINSECIKAAKATLNGDTTVTVNGESINMSDYYSFSGKVSGYRLQIGDHQFK